MKIITKHVYPPIPVRFLDWQAHYEGEEDEQMATGTGATEAEAIRDLILSHPRNGAYIFDSPRPILDAIDAVFSPQHDAHMGVYWTQRRRTEIRDARSRREAMRQQTQGDNNGI